jgi:hypothetical protein
MNLLFSLAIACACAFLIWGTKGLSIVLLGIGVALLLAILFWWLFVYHE